MGKEIDILLRAARRNCAVVERDTHLLWTLDELTAAGESGQYHGDDQLLPVDGSEEVTSPYPGCMQPGSGLASRLFRSVGRTAHFVLFAPIRDEEATPEKRHWPAERTEVR
jgi:hypothetical protein